MLKAPLTCTQHSAINCGLGRALEAGLQGYFDYGAKKGVGKSFSIHFNLPVRRLPMQYVISIDFLKLCLIGYSL